MSHHTNPEGGATSATLYDAIIAFLPDEWAVDIIPESRPGVTRYTPGGWQSVPVIARRIVVTDMHGQPITHAESWGLVGDPPKVNLGPTYGTATPDKARAQGVAVLLAAIDAEERTP